MDLSGLAQCRSMIPGKATDEKKDRRCMRPGKATCTQRWLGTREDIFVWIKESSCFFGKYLLSPFRVSVYSFSFALTEISGKSSLGRRQVYFNSGLEVYSPESGGPVCLVSDVNGDTHDKARFMC